MNKALVYAFRLLKYRARSEYELRERLKKRGFSDYITAEVCLFLKEKSYINDFEFARVWVEGRVRKPLGINRLRQELKIKGVERRIIEKVLRSVSSKFNEEQIINDLVFSRWAKLKNLNRRKAKQRIFLYLVRRGFSIGKVREVISRL